MKKFLKKFYNKNYFLIIISAFITILVIEIFLQFNNKNFFDPVFYKKKIGNKIFNLSSVKFYQNDLEKIVLFGDSFMLGKKCGQEKSLPSLISQDSKNKFSIINFGQPGINAVQIFLNITLYLENEKKPKSVIVGFYSNDIHMDKSYCSFIGDLKNYKFFTQEDINNLKIFCSKKNISDNITRPDWHKFGITQVLNEAIVKLFTIFDVEKFNSRNKFYSDLKNLNSLENKLFRYSIIKISEKLSDENINNTLFFFPNAENLNINSDISIAYKNLSSELLENFEIKIHNGYNFFNVNNNTSMTASLLDKHPNCRYYEIIYKYLSSNNLIK